MQINPRPASRRQAPPPLRLPISGLALLRSPSDRIDQCPRRGLAHSRSPPATAPTAVKLQKHLDTLFGGSVHAKRILSLMPERSGRPLQAPHDVAGTALSLDGQAGRRFHSGGGTASGINVICGYPLSITGRGGLRAGSNKHASRGHALDHEGRAGGLGPRSRSANLPGESPTLKHQTGELVGLRWRFPPASGGGYVRPVHSRPSRAEFPRRRRERGEGNNAHERNGLSCLPSGGRLRRACIGRSVAVSLPIAAATPQEAPASWGRLLAGTGKRAAMRGWD